MQRSMGCSEPSLCWWTFFVGIVVWQSTANVHAEGTIPTCFNEPLTLPCKAIQRVDGIIDVEWKARNINSKSEPWIRFAYCNKFMVCVVTKPRLPNGIEVVNISDAGSLTIQGSAKNSPNSQAQLKCEVHYSDNSKNHRAHQINFTVCIRTQKTADVNLTRAFRSMLPWKQVVDIEMFNTNKTRFAYCNTGGCTKVNDSHYSAPVFWNRLQVKQGSLILTGIVENDDGLEIEVTVHLNASPDDSKAKGAVKMETVRVYTVKILVVNTSQEPKLALPIEPPTTRTDRTSLPPSSHAESPKKSSASTANGQEWTVALLALAVFLVFVFGS